MIKKTLLPLKYSISLFLILIYPWKPKNSSASSEILSLVWKSSNFIIFIILVNVLWDKKSKQGGLKKITQIFLDII